MKEYATTDGGALADEATAEQFATLRLDSIARSLTNPRKIFNPVKLQELADSIASSGVHQPILVRPLPGTRLQDTFDIHAPDGTLRHRPAYELVAGERRYRASILADAKTIPAMIRPLTDAQVLEIQLLENLQRDDLHPMEEAEGYEQLCAATGITKEQVGAKIGKSRNYIYARLKLLDLRTDTRRAFYDGKIDASRALVIARVPTDSLQLKALEYATKTNWQGDVPSHREFLRWVQDELMLKLDQARFSITDITLVPAAGDCNSCSKRTGANPDLFSDVDDADVCIDITCYNLKQATHDEAVIAAAKARGVRVLEGQEAERARSSQYQNNGYRAVDKLDNSTGLKKTIRTLLGDDIPGSVLVAQHDGEMVEMVPSSVIADLLEAKGHISPEQAKQAKTHASAADKAKATGKYEMLWRKKAIEAIFHRSVDDAASHIDNLAILREIAKMMLRGLVGEHRSHTAELLGIGKVADSAGITAHIEEGSADEVIATLLLLLMQHDRPLTPDSGFGYAKRIEAVANDYDISLVRLQNEAKAQLSEGKPTPTMYRCKNTGSTWSGRGQKPVWVRVYLEGGGDLADLLDTAKPKDTAKPTLKPAAQQLKLTETAEKLDPAAQRAPVARETKKRAPAVPAKTQNNAPTLSTQEAITGIADALQGLAGVPPEEVDGLWAVGQRVKVRDTVTAPEQLKWVNKIARLSAKAGPAWTVVFTAPRGKLCTFLTINTSDLEIVE